MKKLKNMTALKKLNIIAVVILSIFAFINIYWVVTAFLPTYGCRARLGTYENDEIMGMCESESDDGLQYVVQVEPYLNGRGFLAVYENYVVNVDLDQKTNDEMYICLYIYPQLFGKYKYTVQFVDESDAVESKMEFVNIDDSLNQIPVDPDNTEVNERQKKLLNDYHDEIQMRMDGAQNKWKLDESETLYGLKVFIKNTFAD